VAAAAASSGRRSGRRHRHRCLRTPPGLTESYQTGGKAGECLENLGRDVVIRRKCSREPSEPAAHTVPLRKGTGVAAASVSLDTTRSNGGYQTGGKAGECLENHERDVSHLASVLAGAFPHGL